MALQKVVKAVMKAAPTALSALQELPTGQPTTSHTGEIARQFHRGEAIRQLQQVKGRGRSTSGGHHPVPAAKNQTDYGPKRSTTPNVMKAAGHTGKPRATYKRPS
jgi:hypothetical protein